MSAPRCDRCARTADTIHVVPSFARLEGVKLACPKHDPGGYWFPIRRWYTFRDHILGTKVRGPLAVALIERRLAKRP